MTLLPNSNPSAHEQLQAGDFAASRTGKPSSKVPVDQTLETTVNKDSKGNGGCVGFSVNSIPVQKWVMSQHERSALAQKCKALVSREKMKVHKIKHKGLRAKAILQEEADIKSIMRVAKTWVNPFSTSQSLCSLSSGIVANSSVMSDLLKAYSTGMGNLRNLVKSPLSQVATGLS